MASKKNATTRKKAPAKKKRSAAIKLTSAPLNLPNVPIDTRVRKVPARARKEKIKAWSFSRYKEHAQCPAKLSYKVHDRLKEPGSPAMDRGNEFHKAAEDYLTGATNRLPSMWPKHWQQRLKQLKAFLKKNSGGAEVMWLFDRTWKAMDLDDKFNPRIWLRVKTDYWCLLLKDGTLLIIDFKTGKQRPDEHQEQLDLYALAGLLLYGDEVDHVQTELWYLDQDEGPNDTMRGLYTPDQLPALKRQWEKKTKMLLNDTRFQATPNAFCRWCHFRASNGGPCRHG